MLGWEGLKFEYFAWFLCWLCLTRGFCALLCCGSLYPAIYLDPFFCPSGFRLNICPHCIWTHISWKPGRISFHQALCMSSGQRMKTLSTYAVIRWWGSRSWEAHKTWAVGAKVKEKKTAQKRSLWRAPAWFSMSILLAPLSAFSHVICGIAPDNELENVPNCCAIVRFALCFCCVRQRGHQLQRE